MPRFSPETWVSGLLMAAFLVATGHVLYRHAEFNGDMVQYTALVIRLTEPDPVQVHRKTFETLARDLPAGRFQQMLDAPDHEGYIAHMARDPEMFRQQLRFFAIRPAYIAAVALAHALGAPLPQATALVSVVSFAACGGLLFLWLAHHVRAAVALVVAVFILLLPGVPLTARLSTPDMLAAFVVLLAAFVMLELRSTRGAAWILVASIAFRSDNLLLAGLFLAFGFFLQPPAWRLGRRELTVMGLVALVLYEAIIRFHGGYGWTTLIYHSIVSHIPRPAETHVTFTWLQYLGFLKQNGLDAIRWTQAVATFLPVLLVLFAGLRSRRLVDASGYVQWALILALYSVAHFLLFPVYYDRHFVVVSIFGRLAAAMLLLEGEVLATGVEAVEEQSVT
jgi:hypothetical protein